MHIQNNRELRPLTKDEQKRVQQRIFEIRKEFGFNIGDPITYEVIDKAHKWVLARFRYKSDDYVFDETDFWNPLSFYWLLLDDVLIDDCDGAGAALLGMMKFVLNVNDNNLFRVSCLTETNEGHFVVWVKADDGIYYQIENRLRQPRTLKYMRDLGYNYMYFSSMAPRDIKPNKWYDAKKKASAIIYDTPAGLETDRPPVTIKSITDNITKSETMNVGNGILGSGVTITSIVAILTNLSGGTDWRIVALVGAYGILAAIAVYFIRARTNSPLFTKQPKELRADNDGFVG